MTFLKLADHLNRELAGVVTRSILRKIAESLLPLRAYSLIKLQIELNVLVLSLCTQQKGGKRGLVKAKVYSKTRTLNDAFIAPRRRGSGKTTVYMRKSGKRLPLKLLYGPGIMQLFRQNENEQIMLAKVRERLPVEFARNLSFYLNRMRR